MANWQKRLVSILKMLLIVVMIGLSSACGYDSDEKSENSLVACDVANQKTDCEPDDNYYGDSKCVSCKIFDLMFEAIDKHYTRMQELFSNGARTFLMIAFAIWLAIRLLKYVSSVTENNIGEVWNEILRKAFICVICWLIIESPDTLNAFINTFIMPIYMAFLELGAKILGAASLDSSGGSLTLFDETVTLDKPSFGCDFSNKIELGLGDEKLPKELHNKMYCMMDYLRNNLSMGGKAGWQAMTRSRGFLSPIIGFILFTSFLIVKICFAFYLVESLFQLAIIIFLLPLFVIAYAFGPTQSWAKKAFTYIIAISAFLMAFAVIVALTVRGMIDLIGGNSAIFNPGDGAKEDLSVGFVCLILMAFLVNGSMGVASSLTSAWVGGSISSNFQKKLKGFAEGVGKAAWKGITALFTFGAAAFPNTVIGRGVNAIKRVKAKADKVQKAAGR